MAGIGKFHSIVALLALAPIADSVESQFSSMIVRHQLVEIWKPIRETWQPFLLAVMAKNQIIK